MISNSPYTIGVALWKITWSNLKRETKTEDVLLLNKTQKIELIE